MQQLHSGNGASVMLSCLNGLGSKASGEEDGGTVVQVMLCRSQ